MTKSETRLGFNRYEIINLLKEILSDINRNHRMKKELSSSLRVRINVNILDREKIVQRAIKSLLQPENFLQFAIQYHEPLFE